MTGNDADAADAAQEALVRVVRHLASFDGRSRFGTWVHRVAVTSSLDELRRRSRRPQPVDELPAARASSPEDAVAAHVDVDRALARLSPDHRAAVVLRDLCGLDYAEIAEVLGSPPGTVRSRIARGRVAVAEALGNPGGPGRRRTEDDE